MSETQPWKFFALHGMNFQFLELNFQFLEGNFKMSEPCVYLLRYREINQTFLLYNNAQDNGLLDRAIRCLEIAKSYVIHNPVRFQQAFPTTAGRIAEKASYLLDEIRKYIFFEGSPDIIAVLNEFAE